MSVSPEILTALQAQNPWWGVAYRLGPGPFPRRRDPFESLRSRLADLRRRRALLLLGPRQVGKTVLLEQIALRFLNDGWAPGNLILFNFADARVRTRAPDLHPEDLTAFTPPGYLHEHPRLLLLDEIHWVTGWQHWLKQVVDADARSTTSMLRILATDSAASVLKQATVESGQGRWDELRIWGLNFREYLRFLSFEGEDEETVYSRTPGEFSRYLAKGGFPAIVADDPSEQVRRDIREDIAERALRRDLLALDPEHSGRLDVERVRRLFVMLIQDSGSIWSRESRASDLSAHPETVTSWLQILEDACLVHRIEPLVLSAGIPSAKRRLAAKPKIYAADHGLIPAFTLDAFPMAQQKVRDRVAETVVLRHLLDLIDRSEVHYFGDQKSGKTREIDFVARFGSTLTAIEVTSSVSIDSQERRTLLETAADMGADRVILIHGGTIETKADDLWLLPLDRFLLDPQQIAESPR
jgi:predicted AAA+ superfamily ATPase